MATRLQIVIPFHQPLSASDEQIEQACDNCYQHVLDALVKHSSVRVAIHFGGHLLDYVAARRPDMVTNLKGAIADGQLEILGGLFYGGPPALLPELDVRGQIQMSAEFWESFIGEAPVGFWLPELACTPELPRMLDETGLSYGFLSSSQIATPKERTVGLGVIERGGYAIGMFALDAGLSAALPAADPDEWLSAIADAAAGRTDPLISTWVRAESLGLEPDTARWCLEQGWLERWLDALTTRRAEIETVLPSSSYERARPARRLRTRPGIATDLKPLANAVGPADWTDFVHDFGETDSIYRRMLRISEKLRALIMTMEEEGYEESWSDTLATAQRMVFAAQSPDLFWRGPQPGFSDPEIRDAFVQRLCRAEAMMDTLAQGEDDWLAEEEEDRDADLVDEIFVSNRLITARLAPVDGSVRTLDLRAHGRNLLDVGARRTEPFFVDMEQAPLANQDPAHGPPRPRGVGLARLQPELSTIADDVERGGIREWLLDADTTPQEMFAGGVGARATRCEVVNSEIDEGSENDDEGNENDAADPFYQLEVKQLFELSGVRPRVVHCTKQVRIPLEGAQLSCHYELSLEGEGNAIVAVEIPLRLGSAVHRLRINDQPVDLVEGESAEVRKLRVEAPGGAAVEIGLDPALDIWMTPIRTTIRDLNGYRSVEQGVVLAPVLRLDRGSIKAVIELRVGV